MQEKCLSYMWISHCWILRLSCLVTLEYRVINIFTQHILRCNDMRCIWRLQLLLFILRSCNSTSAFIIIFIRPKYIHYRSKRLLYCRFHSLSNFRLLSLRHIKRCVKWIVHCRLFFHLNYFIFTKYYICIIYK